MIAAVRGAVKMAANVRRAGCAVIRHVDATKQKLISASGQLNATGANAAQAARRLLREVAMDATPGARSPFVLRGPQEMLSGDD
jgi:hypothetical protein